MPRRPSVPEPNPRQARWQRLVTEQERGALNQREFCEVHGIALSSLSRWRRRLCEQRSLDGADADRVAVEAEPAFLAVALPASTSRPEPATQTLSVTLPSGVRIEGVSSETVATVVTLVAAL